MKTSLKIVFATDFSPSSKMALHVLKQLNPIYSLDVHLIHVLASFWKNWMTSDLCRKEAMQRLNTWQEDLLGETKPKHCHVEISNPAEAILALASTQNANLIMLGSKEANQKSRYKAGVTLENVVRHAKQSVWVCKNESFKKIVCGVDCSQASARALQQAIDLAKHEKAELSIVYVLPEIVSDYLVVDEDELNAEEARIKQEHEAQFDTFLKDFDFSHISAKTHTLWGIASNVLLDMAEDFEHDLIVVGAKGHSKLEHIFLGSNAEKILRFAPCSLLVVR